jgi:hypothetical protein
MNAVTIAVSAGMSIKRRQRLARTLFVISFLSLLAGGLISGQSAIAGDQSDLAASSSFNYVSVMPGDTLWNLASEHAADRSPQDWVAEVILLNNLSSVELVAGEKLALP